MPVTVDDYVISTDRARIDLDWIHNRLSTDTYWAPGRPRERVAQAVRNSLCYGVYHPDGHQVAFARLVTDYAVVAWLGDVYVDREVRGIGIGKLLIERIMTDTAELRLRRVILSTADADELYRRFGFTDTADDPDAWLQRVWPDNP